MVTSCAKQEVTFSEEESVPEPVLTEESGDGEYLIDITMEGGSGKAYILSPVKVTKEEGKYTALLVWNSPNYDYMIVDGVRYENENEGGASTFTVPLKDTEAPLKITADTVAMSKPHEIEYTIYWNSSPQAESSGSFAADVQEGDPDGTEFSELVFTEETELKYAEQFSIKKFEGGSLVNIKKYGDLLLVDEGCPVPRNVPAEVCILKKPLDRTYLVSTSAMDFICATDRLDRVRLTGTKAEDWYIEEAAEALDEGRILYAGKYSSPDYELLLNEGCDLAIENTMIEHKPAVKEKLAALGIPVLIETSSYESHPLGRLEWIKFYGLLFDNEEKACELYEEELSRIAPLMEQPGTGLKVAFFHVTSAGMINVRKKGDYISSMIELAGGEYVPGGGNEAADNMLSTMNIQMEDFYAAAVDADILIYNSTITGELSSVDELIALNALFKDFKAVKNGRVYCTERDLFQQVSGMADFMEDLRNIYEDEDSDTVYLFRLKGKGGS